MKSYPKLIQAILLASIATPAWAHTGLSHTHSFVSGFMHPWSGVDHLLVMFAVGLYAESFKASASVWLPVSFLFFMMIGARLFNLYMPIFAVENGIVLSLFSMGLLLIVMKQLSRIIIFPLLAFFAFCHGYAHSIEMNPGENEFIYLGGLLLSTALLLALGISAGHLSINKLTTLCVLTGVASIAAGTLTLAY
jgi:urease accessory protein